MNRDKYFLRINSKYIIEFNDVDGFSNMDDIMRLNVFTTSFKTEDELIHFLKQLNFIPRKLEVNCIEIVKRIKNAKDGFSYVKVFDTILYKDDAAYLSVKTIKDFFQKNSGNIDVMRTIIASRIASYQITIEKIQLNATLYKNYCVKLSNAKRLLVILNNLENGFPIDQQEYEERIREFIENEIYYKVSNNRELINQRGVIELANVLANTADYDESIIKPETVDKIAVDREVFEELIDYYLKKDDKNENKGVITEYTLTKDDYSTTFLDSDSEQAQIHNEWLQEEIKKIK